MGEQAQGSLDDRDDRAHHPSASVQARAGFPFFCYIYDFLFHEPLSFSVCSGRPEPTVPDSLNTSSQNRRPLPFQVKFPISPDYAPAADSFLTAAAKRREHGRIKKKRQNSPRLGL